MLQYLKIKIELLDYVKLVTGLSRKTAAADKCLDTITADTPTQDVRHFYQTRLLSSVEVVSIEISTINTYQSLENCSVAAE